MRRPDVPLRPTDDAAARQATGRSIADWMQEIDASGASGRAGVGKFLQGLKVDPWWVTVLTVAHEARAGVVEKDGRPKGYSLCVTKTIAAPPERVFASFATAKGLDAWLGAGTTMGGEGEAWANGDGNTGIVRKLRAPKSVVLGWDTPGFAEGSVVEALFQPKGAGTGVVLNHTRIATRDDADAARAMWEEALATLKSRAER